jgi:hypothetical protein
LSLIFANQTEEDILLRQELEEIAADFPDRFKVRPAPRDDCNSWKVRSTTDLPGRFESTAQSSGCFPPPPAQLCPALSRLTSCGTRWTVMARPFMHIPGTGCAPSPFYDSLCPAFVLSVKLWYTLDRPGEGWKFSSGFISEEMVRQHLPAPGPNTQILVCGPPPM